MRSRGLGRRNLPAPSDMAGALGLCLWNWLGGALKPRDHQDRGRRFGRFHPLHRYRGWGTGLFHHIEPDCSRGFAMPAEEIRLVAGDTDFCPDSGITAGSRVTYVVGRSVQIAAQKLKELLQEAAASLIEIAPQDLRLEKGVFYPPKPPIGAYRLPRRSEY